MKGPRVLIILFLSFFLVAAERGTTLGRAARPDATSAAGNTAAAEETRWTIKDMVGAEDADQFEISPDCKHVVWVKAIPDKEKDEMVSNLYLSSLVESKEIQLTRGGNKDEKPKWSPDGQLIAFLSDRPLPKPPSPSGKESDAAEEKEKTQLWLINPFGGEPWPLTESERGVKDFDWIDAGTLLVAAEEDPTLYEREIKEKKDDSEAIEDAAHTPPVRLFKVEVKTKEVTRLTQNRDWIESVAVSPDGKRAVAVHQRSLSFEYDQKVKPITVVYDLETGSTTRAFAGLALIPSDIRWTRDSSGFYAVTPYSTDPIYRQAYVDQLYFYDVASGKATKVDLDWKNDLALDTEDSYDVTPDGFIALLADGVRFKLARYTRAGDGWTREWITGDPVSNIYGIGIGKDGRTLVYNSSAASRPKQWFRATLDGATVADATELTKLNPDFEKKIAARSEIVHWQGSLDEQVDGILFYPQNYEAGKKYPLVLMIHGGPLGVDMDWWDEDYAYPVNLFTERGAFVLRPNYHGGSNYGLKWAESIGGGKYYELEVPDIEKGVDALIARGLVDPERLGTMGWSNGAILTIALTVDSTRYKVASAGAGDVEYISDWGNVDFGASFDNYYLGASPLDNPQLYVRKSPFFRMKDVHTPTLIFFGTHDRSVPPDQGWSHFRALQQIGKTPVRFVLFPGEPHGPKKLSHRTRKLEEDLAWFDKYLFKPGAAPNEALKKDSPLAQELERQKIGKVGMNYGLEVQSTLIPETVRYKGLDLGRFEVTRAQFAAFDRNYRIEPGTGNYPASGITFEQAQAYCAWLSKLTGETYRLGSEQEMEPIYKTPASSENTLDYWAGYKANPDDAERLQEKIDALKGPAPLLKEVGSFSGAGENELVFDLGGNVAEWAVAKDGSGKTLGGSADQPDDPKAEDSEPAAEYIGFRVVKGAAAAKQP